MDNREANYTGHPPACTCVKCTRRRMSKISKQNSFDPRFSSDRKADKVFAPAKLMNNNKNKQPTKRKSRNSIPKWAIALLLIFGLSIIGLGISTYTKTNTPFYILLWFSFTYSIERWASSTTRKHKGVGKLYRLFLNISILSLLSFIVWSGVKLFSQQLSHSSLVDSLVFLVVFIFFIWAWRVVAKNSWRFPSMKLTVFSLICLFLVFAFAGVQPMSDYKGEVFSKWDMYQTEQKVKTEEKLAQIEIKKQENTREQNSTIVTVPIKPNPTFIIEPEIVSSKDIILRNPSWEELKAFLLADKTDQMEYVFPTTVCEDFAKALQSNAKKAGLRCAFVSVRLNGYPDWFHYGIPSNTGHALNAFETTDRGLVYIDDTGLPANSPNPGNCDKIVDVKIGGSYLPKDIFSTYGWGDWGNMGTIVGIEVTRW